MQTLNAIISLTRDEAVRQHSAMATVIGAVAGLALLTMLAPTGGMLSAAPPGAPAALLVPLALSL